MKNFLSIVFGVLIGLLAAGIIYLAAIPERGEPVALLPSPTPQSVMVYMTGAVVLPGLYILPEGSRINDAVLAAGGYLPHADQERVNLAEVLYDGERIEVPEKDHLGGEAANPAGERVNINTAAMEELDILPGIGPTTAQSIVSYRQQHGLFRTIEEIQNVPGIGPVTFEKIKNLITVGP